MQLWSALRRVFSPRASYGSLEERAFADLVRQYNASGVSVTEHTALMQATVWACVRVISESLAMLPIDVVQKANGRRQVLDDSDIAWMLNTTPDGEVPAFRFRETLIAHALLWHGGFAEIVRGEYDKLPKSLHLITPDRVDVRRDDAGQLVYHVRQAAGEPDKVLGPNDVLHVAGLGFDSVQGYKLVQMARQSFGLDKAMETFASAFFGNGMQLGTVYTTEQILKSDQIAALREQLEGLHRGAAKAFRAAILSGGLKPTDPPMALAEAQFLEGRRFAVLEVCRWFRVPPHLVMELERATHSNVEQEQMAFVQHCLLPWATRIEAELNLKLFGRNQRGRQSVKHNFGALLRGDTKTRMEAYRIAREGGWLNANEIRELEDRNPIGEDGELYLVPANMTTPERLREPPEPVVQTVGTDGPAEDDEGDEDPVETARARMRVVRSQTHEAA